jgi:hypothetical protein
MDWDLIAKQLNGGQLAKEDIELLKAAVSATSIGIGGAITPAASRQYFTTVTDQSTFLGRVSSTQVDALQQDVDLFAVSDQQLQRVAEGSEPSTITGASNAGKRWALLDVQLFPTINFSTIVQRQRQGNIEAYLANLFATVFRNDLLLLGLIGDTTSGTPFIALNDGWVELSKDAVASTARDITNIKTQRLSHGVLSSAKITHGTVSGGPYVAGETVTGGTSSATGVVQTVGSGYLVLHTISGTFQTSEVLTGGTSSATSTSSSAAVAISAFIMGETITGATSSATGVITAVGTGYIDLTSISGTFQAAEAISGATSDGYCTAVTVLGTVGIDYLLTMDAMLAQMADKYLREDKTCFMMSKKDALAWGKQMGLYDGLNPYLVTGKVPMYQGYEVIGIAGFPANKIVLSDPKNWGFGMGTTIQRWRDLVARKRAIEYTWQLYADYIVINDEAVVYSD